VVSIRPRRRLAPADLPGRGQAAGGPGQSWPDQGSGPPDMDTVRRRQPRLHRRSPSRPDTTREPRRALRPRVQGRAGVAGPGGGASSSPWRWSWHWPRWRRWQWA